jgi:hypothetical protein
MLEPMVAYSCETDVTRGAKGIVVNTTKGVFHLATLGGIE